MKEIILLIKIINFLSNIFIGYLYDIWRFLKYSTTISNNNFQVLEGRIMANAHVLEKGLSFEKTKLKFGKVIINNLIKLLEKYLKKRYPTNNFAFKSGFAALVNYQKFHKENNISFKKIDDFIYKNKSFLKNNTATTHITQRDYKELTGGNFESLSRSRHSVRDFSEKPVPINLINQAIKLALNTPSVCNRQSWKTHLITNKKLLKEILNLQNGNRGFSNKIDKLLIVSTSLRSFQGANERNQAYIDGGLFSMSLIYALHYKNIGVCPLNWASTIKNDILLKRKLNISSEETIILMIALGSLKKDFLVTMSRKKSLKDVITIYE